MSKTLSENISSFSERIVKILKDKGLIKKNGQVNYSEAERKCGMKGTVLQKAVKRNGGLYDDNLDKFLRTFQVRRDWLLKGTGDIYDKNGTYVEIPTPMENNNEVKAPTEEQVLKQLIEKNEKYSLVPNIILTQYEIQSKAEILRNEEVLKKALAFAEQTSATKDIVIQAKNDLIAELKKEIAELRMQKPVMATQKAH